MMKQCVLLLSILAVTAHGAEEKRKNVLLFISDDQGYCELGSFLKFADPDTLQPKGKDILKGMLKTKGGREAVQVCFDAVKKATPNLDRIAAKGVRFTNFYAAPTCGPSRAALMSAKYPQRFGAYSNTELSDGAGVPPSVGFPVKAFADAGYRTGIFGKWHLGRDAGQHPNDRGFDTYFGYDSPPRIRTLITERWRMTISHGVTWGELYDLENDPSEMSNLWDDTAHATVRAELTEMLARRQMDLVDRSPLPTAVA